MDCTPKEAGSRAAPSCHCSISLSSAALPLSIFVCVSCSGRPLSCPRSDTRKYKK